MEWELKTPITGAMFSSYSLLFPTFAASFLDPGADPEIEEGGHTYRVEIGVARVGRSCPCMC